MLKLAQDVESVYIRDKKMHKLTMIYFSQLRKKSCNGYQEKGEMVSPENLTFIILI